MEYRDEDFLDEANLIEIPCEFCNDLFPIILLMEHQTACRPDLARMIEPTVEEVETQFRNLENNLAFENPIDVERIDPPTYRNQIQIEEIQTSSIPKEKEQINRFAIDEDNQEAIEKALLQENEAFSFGSSNKEKNVDEEKLSFKYPPNSFLNNKDSKYHIQNDLTESDNEENESLEEFWKRADIKLVQRLRMLQKNSPHY
ncbi:uncharacterized protein [Parasteatoda tepidariorum]|uniref:uncharacterized protein isoform X3 n=1 Tax=Parasteatoda tepidariorum TaxID=114398 RepID=UPI00077F9702|nr:uncharacterized protein LOC107451979 isoform X3 [Parasteatoda tepidariorum]